MWRLQQRVICLSNLPVQSNPHHDRLALSLITEALKAPQSAEAKLYLRMLFQLRPSTDNVELFKKLFVFCENIIKVSVSVAKCRCDCHCFLFPQTFDGLFRTGCFSFRIDPRICCCFDFASNFWRISSDLV